MSFLDGQDRGDGGPHQQQSPGQFPYTAPGQGWQLPAPAGMAPLGALARQAQLGVGGGGPTGFEPFIRTPPSDRMGDLGSDDMILQAVKALGGGGVGGSPFMPNMRDLPGLVHNITMGLGRWGGPGVRMPAINMGKFLVAFLRASQASQLQHARLAMDQFKLHALETQQKSEELGKAYGQDYALYGSDPAKLQQAILDTARDKGDHEVEQIFNQGGFPMVEKLLKYRQSQLGDLKKTNQALQIRERENNLKIQEERIRKTEAARKANEAALGPYRNKPGAAPATPGTAAPGAPAAVPSTIPHMPASAGSPEDLGAGPRVTSEDGSASADAPAGAGAANDPNAPIDITAPPADTDTGPQTTPVEPLPAEAPAAPETTASDAETTDTTDTGDQAETEPPPQATAAAEEGGEGVAAQPPIQIAEADTGVASDAPSPAEQEMAKRRRQQVAQAGGAAGPTGIAPWEQPSKGHMLPSAAIDAARRAGFQNTDIIEQQGRAAVNNQLRIQDWRAIPPEVRPFIQARGQELAREFDRILTDPTIRGDEVYRRIAEFDPSFAATLHGYVSGNVPPPASAWQNPSYRDRVVGLGNKVDPSFTYHTFKTRGATLVEFARGADGRTITSIATAYDHASRLLDALNNRPWWWQELLSNPYTGRFTGPVGRAFGLSSEERSQQIGNLQNLVNTFNSEYESALARGGRATVSARAHQEAETPLRLGDAETMIGNIRSKLSALYDRNQEMKARFAGGTGFQPDAMTNYVENATNRARLQQLDSLYGPAGRAGRGGGAAGGAGWKIETVP